MNATPALFLAFVSSFAAGAAAQPLRATLVDAILFYAKPPLDDARYSGEIRNELREYDARARAYRPRPRPATLGGEMRMVFSAREGYERKLVAAADRDGVDRLAQDYVDALKPCYEWEGFHDCPEREAQFAEGYLAKTPDSPFAAFLTLLSAHRWLCAAEGYAHEERPADAARARERSRAPLASAMSARSVLMRAVAEELAQHGRCGPEP